MTTSLQWTQNNLQTSYDLLELRNQQICSKLFVSTSSLLKCILAMQFKTKKLD
jgi:hypothetical protein